MEEYLFLLIIQEIIRLRQRLSLRPHLDPHLFRRLQAHLHPRPHPHLQLRLSHRHLDTDVDLFSLRSRKSLQNMAG